MFSRFFNRIYHIKVYGNIDNRIVDKISLSLKSGIFTKCKLVAVSINSGGGSPIQARNVVELIKQFSKRRSIPVYTFAEDACLSAATILLTAGDKVFANEYSLLGDIGYSVKKLGLKNLLADWQIEQKFITSGKNKVRLSSFDDLKPEDVAWINNLLKEREESLIENIWGNRKQVLEKINVTEASFKEKIQNTGLITSDKALDLGIVDKLNNFETVAFQEFPDLKVFEVIRKGALGEILTGRSEELSVLNNRMLYH